MNEQKIMERILKLRDYNDYEMLRLEIENLIKDLQEETANKNARKKCSVANLILKEMQKEGKKNEICSKAAIKNGKQYFCNGYFFGIVEEQYKLENLPTWVDREYINLDNIANTTNYDKILVRGTDLKFLIDRTKNYTNALLKIIDTNNEEKIILLNSKHLQCCLGLFTQEDFLYKNIWVRYKKYNDYSPLILESENFEIVGGVLPMRFADEQKLKYMQQFEDGKVESSIFGKKTITTIQKELKGLDF